MTTYEVDQAGEICRRRPWAVLRATAGLVWLRAEKAVGGELRFDRATGRCESFPGRYQLSPVSLQHLARRLAAERAGARQLDLFSSTG